MNAPAAEQPQRTTGVGRVVVSHRFTEEDQRLVRQLVAELEAAGIACWYAPRDTSTTGDYGAEIVGAIKEATAVVALITPAANESNHIRNELTIALEADRPITGLMTTWEIALRDGLEYRLAGVKNDFTPQYRPETTKKLIAEFSELTGGQLQLSPPPSQSAPHPLAAAVRTISAPSHRLEAPTVWGALVHRDGIRLVVGEAGAVSVLAVEPAGGQRALQRVRLGDSVSSLVLATSGRGMGVAVDGALRTATLTGGGRLDWHDNRRPLPAGVDDLVALHQKGESWTLWMTTIDDHLARTTFHSLGEIEEVDLVERNPHVEGVRDALGSAPLAVNHFDTASAGSTHLFAGVDGATSGDVLRLVSWTGEETEQRTLATGGPISRVAVARAPGGRGALGPVLAVIGDELLVWDWEQAEGTDGPG